VATAPPSAPLPDRIDAPALESEVPDVGAEAEVARLLGEGFRSLDAGAAAAARDRAREVEARFPTTRGSSRALLLRARASLALGAHDEADEAASRYLALVPPGDPERPRARLVLAEARLLRGAEGGVEALFLVPSDAPPDVRRSALERARTLADGLEDPVLRDLVEEAPSHPWLLPVFQVELGARRSLVGDREGGLRLAEAALSLSPEGPEIERARAIRAGEVAPAGTLVGALGSLLSHSGPPTLQQLSSQLRDGIEVALLAPGVRGGVRLLNEDDAGSAGRASEALVRLEGEGVLGVVGPLTEAAVTQAVRSGNRQLPLISPTAPLVPDDLPGAFSLAGPDPEGPRTLARLALALGIREVVILHPRDQAEEREAHWFREAFEGAGGRVSRTLVYAPGTTSFDQPLREVVRLRPRGLVLLLPPEDVELVAPQVAFYGVDDLEDLVILGGAAFSSESVLGSVPARHTDGVYSVAPHVGPGYGPLWSEFVRAYEEHFRRTLRSPVPALGFDAARLLLEGARLGGGTSARQVLAGLSRVQDLPGATGTFSIREGRLVRDHFPVRIEGRRRIPLEF
jgi:ABC-type branched-subunit amino acid transport system substrate-binding protein